MAWRLHICLSKAEDEMMIARHQAAGFTLVEIMIVVSIIGLVAAIAIPSFSKARQESRLAAAANDIRILYDAFQAYAMENGGFSNLPADAGVAPAYLVPYLKHSDWSKTPLGGRWYYKSTCFGALSYRPAIGFSTTLAAPFNQATMRDLDRKIDDGNLATGQFVMLSANAYYLMLDM